MSKEKKSEKVEFAEVTIRVPKPLIEFLEAVRKFTREEGDLGEFFVSMIVEGSIDLLTSNSLDEIFPGTRGTDLIKAYNLDKLDP